MVLCLVSCVAVTGKLKTKLTHAPWNESFLLETVGLLKTAPRKKDIGKPTQPPYKVKGLFQPLSAPEVLLPPLGNRTDYQGHDKKERNLMW